MANNDIVPGFDDEKDENLTIKLQEVPDIEGCLILVLNGYINTYNSHYFQKQVQQAIELGFIRLIFDCNGLNSVSSTGIGSFTAFLKTVKSKGGDLILLELQPKVNDVLQLLDVSRYFNIQSNLGQSIGFFRSDGEVFPRIFPCPICSQKLQAVKTGRFRCSECKAFLSIDNSGKALVG